ncbi:MAG: hypothetical protein RMK01_07190, partial [Thermomicrobium sp.]|nr:hypothetical protein [Thermomicrobium sp.]
MTSASLRWPSPTPKSASLTSSPGRPSGPGAVTAWAERYRQRPELGAAGPTFGVPGQDYFACWIARQIFSGVSGMSM